MNEVPIDARVSPNLHPAAMVMEHDALNIDGSPGAAAWHDAQQAVSLGYTTLSAINDAEAALAKVYAESGARRTQHPNGRSEYLGPIRMDGGTGRLRVFTSHEEEFVEAVNNAAARAAKVIDARRASILRTITALETRVKEALLPRVGPGLAAEIRAHVKSLKAGERLSFLQAAAQAGDVDTIGSVITAPPYLSGVDEKTVTLVREVAARAVAPRDWDQARAAERTLVQVEAVGSALLKRVADVSRRKDSVRAHAGEKVAALRRVGAST
ncbi:hypothetical protein GXW77_13255 [Roseomonas alkaliterrae]|uniref:hypothetical protein n=1 Tax=Neoroseomonas alkaliterrae TaxID=1452450 RepID=UPI001BA88670|nr:hypothetical protein [Neoroseomonas alkaliterrae]MBR0677145.1 hypothetical protein [Neoroseomonas alkaliterrae]